MTFIRIGEPRKDALEMLVEINPRERFVNRTSRRLDFLLRFLAEHQPEERDDFVSKLTARYREQAPEDHLSGRGIDPAEAVESRETLKTEPELAASLLNYFLAIVGMPAGADFGAQVEVPNQNALRSDLLPRYNNLLTLIDVLGREDAVKFYKRYISAILFEVKQDIPDRYPDMDALFEARKPLSERPMEWVVVHGMLAEGKFAYKNENCTWVEALQEIVTDKELMYLICCYGDYQGVTIENQHFILTMEHTIAEGDAYCSRVIHDPRVDWDLRHPPKEFWENEMNPAE